jgi:SAM-dependent methyltransferase
LVSVKTVRPLLALRQSRGARPLGANDRKMPTPYTIREQAEVVRSDYEAAHTSSHSLTIAPQRLRRYSNASADTSYALEYAHHLVGSVEGRTVLDLGCGSGTNSVLLSFRGAHVIGLDISTSLLAIARERARATGVVPPRFLAASAHDMPIASASVDLLFGIAILHHLDLPRVASEVHRILRSGGRAIFKEPVRNSPLIRRLRAIVPYRAPDVSPFERPLTDGELRAFAETFVLKRQRAFSLPHVNLSRVLPIVRNHPHKILMLDRALLKRFSSLERFAGIRVIELEKS